MMLPSHVRKKKTISSKVGCRLIVAKRFMFFHLFIIRLQWNHRGFINRIRNMKKAVVLLATIFSLEKTNPP